MRAVAIDFETANERRASACAIGLAWIEGREITRRAYSLIRPPEMRFSPWNIRVHGIRPEDVEDAPDLPTFLAPFIDDLAGSTILAHNAGFDIAVLCGTLAAYGLTVPRLTYLCTKAIARRSWPEEPRFGLAPLAAKVGLSFRHHHAGEDAYACARIALAAAETAGTRHVSMLADRLGISSGFVDWPHHVPCRGARPDAREDRPILVRRAQALPGRLAFSVRGSGGNLYDVIGAFERGGYRLRCSCVAGQHRRRCRHVTALLDGEITDLVSENHYDLDKLRAVVQALGPEAVAPPTKRMPTPPVV